MGVTDAKARKVMRKMKARFKANIYKTGNTNVLTVPAQYVKDGVVEMGKDYIVTIEEDTEAAS